jgi:hypothetical protein
MNKWLGGGFAFGFAAIGTLVLAGPGSAQAEPLQATIEPTTVEQGGTVTLTSIDPCVDGEGVPGNLTVDIFFGDEEEPFQSDEFDLTPEEDPEGQWALEYTGDPNEEPGIYTYIVTCFGDDQSPIGEYVPLSAETVAAPEPTTPPGPTPTPTPPPAPPVTRVPNTPG